MASSLSLFWFSIQWSLRDPYDLTLLRCVCWNLMNFEFMISYIFLYPWKLFEFFDLLYAWSVIASYFFSDIWVFFGQIDLFILQWEEVLCNGFDLTVLDPSDRRGTDTYVSLLLRITRWDLYLSQQINRSRLHHVIVLIALPRFSMNLIHYMHAG